MTKSLNIFKKKHTNTRENDGTRAKSRPSPDMAPTKRSTPVMCFPCKSREIATKVLPLGKGETSGTAHEGNTSQRDMRALILGLKDGIELCLETIQTSRALMDDSSTIGAEIQVDHSNGPVLQAESLAEISLHSTEIESDDDNDIDSEIGEDQVGSVH